jgi:hypothetical protein
MWLVAFSGIVLIIIITIIAVGKSMEKPKVAPNENKKCAPPQPCKLCTGMPCQCAQVLPGQVRCPVCGINSVQASPASGISNCCACQRAFRCPGSVM